MSESIIFFGNERLASGVNESGLLLQSLIDVDYKVEHIIINQSEMKSRSKRKPAVLQIAEDNNINVVSDWDKDEIKKLISESKAKVGILAAFGRIIPESIIEAFEFGILNIHPSLLPQYRGSTPIESAILDGFEKTGVSLMSLVKAMDAGPVYGHAYVELTDETSKQQLFEELLDAGQAMLIELLPKILSGEVVGMEQDESEASYCSTLTKNDGKLDFSKSAQRLAREVRAYLGWPGSRTEIGGKDVVITEAKVSQSSGEPGKFEVVDGSLLAYCSEGALEIIKLKPAGKTEMATKAFLVGNSLD